MAKGDMPNAMAGTVAQNPMQNPANSAMGNMAQGMGSTFGSQMPGQGGMSAGPASAPTLASQGFGQSSMGQQGGMGQGVSPGFGNLMRMLQLFSNRGNGGGMQSPVGQNTQGAFQSPTQPTQGPVRTAPLTPNSRQM